MGSMRIRKTEALFALAALYALASGCSGDTTSLAQTMKVASAEPVITGSTADAPRFDPFADASTTATPVGW